MDITNDMINIFVVHKYLAMAALDEHLLEFLDGGGILHGIDLSTRHHTVANLRLREIEGVLEDLHLLAYLVLIIGIIDTGLHQVVEVDFCKFAFLAALVHVDAEATQQSLGKHRGKAGYGP